MNVIFVAGPYRGDVEANIARARSASLLLWKQGWAVVCPHMNTAHMDDDGLEDDVVLEGDLELLRRCDAIFLLRGWRNSKGAIREAEEAAMLDITMFHEEDGYPAAKEKHK